MGRRESDGIILETKKKRRKNIAVCGEQNFVGGILEEEKYKRRGKHARLGRGTPMIEK